RTRDAHAELTPRVCLAANQTLVRAGEAQRLHLEHQLRPSANPAGPPLPQEGTAGRSVPAGDEVPERPLSSQAAALVRLSACRLQRPEGLQRGGDPLPPPFRADALPGLLRAPGCAPPRGDARAR